MQYPPLILPVCACTTEIIALFSLEVTLASMCTLMSETNNHWEYLYRSPGLQQVRQAH